MVLKREMPSRESKLNSAFQEETFPSDQLQNSADSSSLYSTCSLFWPLFFLIHCTRVKLLPVQTRSLNFFQQSLVIELFKCRQLYRRRRRRRRRRAKSKTIGEGKMSSVFSVDEIADSYWSSSVGESAHPPIGRSQSEWALQRFLLEGSSSSSSIAPGDDRVVEAKQRTINDHDNNNQNVLVQSDHSSKTTVNPEECQAFLKSQLHMNCAVVAHSLDHFSTDEARHFAGTCRRVLLLTMPPSVGYEQNPLSLYYCYDSKGGTEHLHKCIAEVTNTPWSERVIGVVILVNILF